MRRDRFKEDFQFEANSKWNLFIFTHHKYRNKKYFSNIKSLQILDKNAFIH